MVDYFCEIKEIEEANPDLFKKFIELRERFPYVEELDDYFRDEENSFKYYEE